MRSYGSPSSLEPPERADRTPVHRSTLPAPPTRSHSGRLGTTSTTAAWPRTHLEHLSTGADTTPTSSRDTSPNPELLPQSNPYWYPYQGGSLHTPPFYSLMYDVVSADRVTRVRATPWRVGGERKVQSDDAFWGGSVQSNDVEPPGAEGGWLPQPDPGANLGRFNKVLELQGMQFHGVGGLGDRHVEGTRGSEPKLGCLARALFSRVGRGRSRCGAHAEGQQRGICYRPGRTVRPR